MTKAERARQLHHRGISVAAISRRLDMEPTNVRKALKRNSPQDENRSRRKYENEPQGRLNEHMHNVVKTWQRRPEPQGYCMAWVVEDGRAHRCGALCKGQLCDEHAHTTLPIASPLGRRDYA